MRAFFMGLGGGMAYVLIAGVLVHFFMGVSDIIEGFQSDSMSFTYATILFLVISGIYGWKIFIAVNAISKASRFAG